ncbi:MAG TPA: amino acid adenylation domain-containing protein [Pseudomonadales bacterium]
MDSKAALKARLETLTPEQRAELLQQISRRRARDNPPGNSPHNEPRPAAGSRYPLSLAQRRLWVLSQLGNDASAAYNIASAFYFADGLDVERLEHAWRRLLASHEVLRSAFSQEGDALFQVPRDAATWQLQRQPLAPARDPQEQLLELARVEAGRPFDLQHDWLLRVIHCAAADGIGATTRAAGLVIVIHHIVCDGLSIACMTRELAKYYAEAGADAGDDADAGVALQYRDYVDFETRADTSAAKAYWKNIFASVPDTLDALLDRPRPVRPDFSGSAATTTLAAADVAAFEALCHAQGATLYMGLVALVQLLLARMANVGDVTLGTPVAGRPSARFGRVVGPFVNTVALRQAVDRNATFATFLKQVRHAVLRGFEHQGLAFDELVTTLGLAKEPGRSPLYDAMLGLNTADELALAFGASVGRPLRIPPAHSKVDLTFHFERARDGSLRLDLEYATAVLMEATALRLCKACSLLVSAIPRDPERALGAFALQTDADCRALLDDVNATARPYPRTSWLIDVFRSIAQTWPDALAVHAGDVQLRYRELDALSEQLARRLRGDPAFAPGCRIALMLEKDARALIVMLAILKCRAVYVPLAANTPLQRARDVLATGAVRLIFAEAERCAEMRALALTVLDTDALLRECDGTAAMHHSAPYPASDRVDEDSLAPAYLMFTSGSTGKPKGTLIDQRSVLRLVCNTDYHQVQAYERVLLTGSLAFDAATFEIWGPLLNGGCVCIPPGTTLLEVQEFEALVDHYQVDTAFLTTGLFNQLVDKSAPAFARLKTVLTGGEKISVDHARKLLHAHPALKLLHVYGPTENTTFSTWHRIREDDLALATIPIGRPVANSRIYLLDPLMQPVPIGVPGEIYCGGDGIARGYLEQSDGDGSNAKGANAAAFLADPFLPGGAGRLYRTGDLAKWNEARELVFLGRNDRQVKIRGFRVELGEVEHHLRTLPGVADAFVQARGPTGGSELVAWLVADAAPGSGTNVAAVRAALQGRLPNYMLPAKVVCVPSLPLNASGKVDASALPLPESVEVDAVEPGLLHGKAEQDLARLYATVLGLTGSAALAIDRDANFFALGGDSIRAIQLVSLARSAGYHFALRDLFASETLAGLAASAMVASTVAPEALLRRGPLSPTQLWWLDRPGMPANHFNLSSIFTVAGAIDTTLLRATLDELLELHPALRLELDAVTGEQRINDTGRYVLREVGTGQSRQQCWQELQQAIDLRAGVLLAVGVAAGELAGGATVGASAAEQGEQTSHLAVVVHHLAADEISGRLFAENLARLYQRNRARRHGEAVGTAHEPVREALGLVNWAAQLRNVVAQGRMDQDIGYWQDVVARGRAIQQRQQHLFMDSSAARGVAELAIDGNSTQRLLQLGARVLRMTPQELLLAAFIGAWHSALDEDGCLMSLEGHGREPYEGLGDCGSTLGWFTSLFPFAVEAGDASELDLYRRVKDGIRHLPARGFTYLPLRYYKSDATRTALALEPRISFNYLGSSANDPQAWLQTSAERAGADHGIGVPEPFALDVLARVADGQLELTLRGMAPRPDVSLAALADAWRAELEALAPCLERMTAGAGPNSCLLSLADCMVPFESLAELDATLAALRVPALGVAEILPLTGMQAGMWLHCTTHPSAYQDQVALRLQYALDEPHFAAAVQALVAETQALRTGFAQTPAGALLQVVFCERKDKNYRYVDASGWGDAREEKLARLRATLRGTRSDLLREPLFSLTLVRIGASCFELIVDFHHIALDGWTSALLLQRLEALYFAEAAGGDSGAGGGMRPYFEWLRQRSTALAREYWQGLLGDYQGRSDVPAPQPRMPASVPEPLFVETRTGAALHAQLMAWCGQQGLTVNAVVQTLWAVFLGRLTGSDDVVFGATVSGRDVELPGVARIAGMLINTLPVRIRPTEAASFADLVRATARQFADSMAHGHLALADIMSLAPARTALVTHALVFENYPAADAGARWRWEPQEIFDPMHFEFGLIVAPLADDLGLRFVADGSLYLRAGLERMGAELCALLAALLDPQQAFEKLACAAPAGAVGWSVSANFTADALVGLLQYHEYLSGNSGAVTLLPYDQSVQELINPGSRLRRIGPRHHVVLWRPATAADGSLNAEVASAQLAELSAAVAGYARGCTGSRVYLVLCPWLDHDEAQYREFAAYAKGACAGLHNVDVLGLDKLAALYDLQQPCHPPELVFGDIPYTDDFFAALATRLARHRDLQRRRPVKVYVVDADDTLWGGIVGEEGAQGVRLEPAHLHLQESLLRARAAGALICIATKNNEDDVRAVFQQRTMPLRWEHLTRVCAGWGPKSESVRKLAVDLSLGLDSFVFIDDSPLECEEVLAACPGVLAIQLPPAQEREAFLAHLWLLDAKAATREDAARAQMYAEESQRSIARAATGSYAEFLAALDIRVEMGRVRPDDLARVAQLSQRTNQFNTSGVRYSETELQALLQEPDTDLRCVRVGDKYGAYGLTGAIFIRRGPDAWTVFGFMLSCRVLGRGVEHTILRTLAREAAASGARSIDVDFVRLPRNAPALQFLQSLCADAATARFSFEVEAAERWQPGADDSHAANAANANDSGAGDADAHALAAPSLDARRLAERSSAYYAGLARTLHSGAAIVQQMRRHGVIRNTGGRGAAGGVSTPPVTPTESTLAGYFAAVLEQQEIFRDDSFHDLGGHSLKAMMLLSRIASGFGVTLDFRDVQAYPTVRALSERIDAALAGTEPGADAGPVLRALPPAASYPAAPGQARLWMLEQLRGAGPSPFHMHATLTVAGSIDRPALDRALHILLQRHEALRTCFSEDAHGGIRQVVVAPGLLDARVEWLADLHDESTLEACARQQGARPFALDQAPLLRIAGATLRSGGTALFITLQHIISDGWSLGILSRDLTDLYRACCDDGSDVAESRPALQFRDFASWQLEWLASAAGARALQFWREHFARPVEALQLPAAAPRPALKQGSGASVSSVIGAATWARYSSRLSMLGVSDFAGLLAAVQLVLGRLSQQQDFCIGTAVAGRPHPGLESVIGFFVNVLPLRTTLDLAHTVDAFLRAVADEVNACLSHQGVPFDTIVTSLDLARDTSRTPLFDVMLVLQNTDVPDLRFGTEVAEVLPIASTTSQYDLTLSAFPAADGTLALLAEYDNAIYSEPGIALILRCIERALEGLAASSHEALASVAWLQDRDLAHVIGFEGALHATTPESAAATLPDLLRRVVPAARGSIGDAQYDWSYPELLGEMERIASLLRAALPSSGRDTKHANRQFHVGVIGRRSVRSIAAMLGAMDAGAVYVPLDLANPVDRLVMNVQDGGVDLLLSTDGEGAALACALQQRQPGLRHVAYADSADHVESANSAAHGDARAIAYMIFTSGSTGRPKGVQVTHAAFAAMIAQQVSLFDVRATDVCGQFATLAFDASLSEIFLALSTGASLVLAPDAARGDIDTFMDWLDTRAISVLTLPPAFLRALARRQLGALRVLVTAGEAAIAEDLRHYAASLHVVNAYGPTETAVCASTYVVNANDAWPFGVPIGKPLPGARLSVRDATGARVPAGVTGELYIGGAIVGAGYFGEPELTARKFTTLPGEPEQERWYRSGDLVRWRDDGALEFFGRRDAQVKVRGYRIEPGEIEQAARALPGVDDAVALVHPRLGLVLYCVSAAAQSDASELKAHVYLELGRTLPRHMIPSVVVVLEAWPLSPSGKIARDDLLALPMDNTTAFAPPQTSHEEVLAQVWRQVLKTEQAGRDDDFFALGGDSIKALEALSALRTLGLTCELKDFFAFPRLAAMAAALTPWRDTGRFRAPIVGHVELLPVQAWFLRSRDSAVARHFNIVTELHMAPVVSERVLEQVLAALMRRHDSLRARFCLRDGNWVQEIQQDVPVAAALGVYQCVESRDAPMDSAAIAAEACRPFTLDSAPLFRCLLVRGTDGRDASVVLALHHLIADWVSLRILIADLNALTLALLAPMEDEAGRTLHDAQTVGALAAPQFDPPHMLRDLAAVRAAEVQSMLTTPGHAWLEAYHQAVDTMAALAPARGVHAELETLHLRFDAGALAVLHACLRRASAVHGSDFRLQDLLLAVVLRGLGRLPGLAGAVPLLIEGHGRDGTLDLARQVGWMTRARLRIVEPSCCTGPEALLQAQRVLQQDAGPQPDLFACMVADADAQCALPALLSFNYLGEFANSQERDAPFRLAGTVFDDALTPASPVDVPLQMEAYVVDGALEIQVAWLPGVFDSGAMRACWEEVRRTLDKPDL